MNDTQILNQIGSYVQEEHELWDRASKDELTPEERDRLGQLKIALDQCWDLLDQRRALRDAGRNPNEAKLRDPTIVENYEQ